MTAASRRVSFLRRLALLAAGVAGSLLLLEAGLRLLAPQPLSPPLYDYDPDTVLRHIPEARGIDASPEYRYEFAINSKGLRDRETPYEKPAGSFRILGLGDSFTFGIGVALEDTYLKRIEASFRARGAAVEALNAGCGGFGTGAALNFLRRDGMRYRPDLVLLGFFGNDPSDDLRDGLYLLDGDALVARRYEPQRTEKVRSVTRLIPFYGFLAAHSHALNLVRRLAIRALHGEGPRGADAARFVEATSDFALTRRLLAEISRVAREGGARLAVVLIPHVGWFEGGADGGAELRSAVAAHLAEIGVPVLDLFPRFRSRPDLRALYFPIDRHFTPLGHAAAAEAIVEFLAAEGIGPPQR